MVIVLPGGTTILESGDPDYQDIVIGSPDPQNEIIDPDPTKPLSQLVLETFNIPFSLPVLGGELPGQDIRNQDAATTLKLSLATELLDSPAGSAGFAEVELDEDGIARFYVVGATLATNLDVRYCVPTSQVTTPADLVIVRGYDPPPERRLRSSFDGLKNAEVMEYKECAANSCDEKAVGKFATVSYDDPLLDQIYLDDVLNSYELEAFESLVGYLVDLDLPDGADRDSPNYNPGMKITFGDTTKEYITTGVNIFNTYLSEGITGLGTPGLFGTPATTLTFGSSGFGGGGTIPVTITEVDEKTGECTESNTSIAGGKIAIPASRFERLNKFGNLESDFTGVSDVVFAGRKIIRIDQLGNIFLRLYVRDQKEFMTLQHGKNWVWDVDENGNVTIELFSILEDEFTAKICRIYGSGGTYGLFGLTAPGINISRIGADGIEETGSATFDGAICNLGGRLGYLAVNNTLCIVVERKRPSIDIFDPNGQAVTIARGFIGPGSLYGVRYTPVVIVDEPAPIAYASTRTLSSIDGTRTLPTEKIIDQTDGIVDADPTTTQDIEDSEISILQDNTSGSTIDMTLPFCTDQQCLQIAKNFLGLQNEVITTQSVILGPTSEPQLGQVMPDGAIINEINYSYSDSSQYLITITTGPKYQTAGSFNDSKYQLRTDDVTREGVVMQDAGNGAEYVVRVEGFGEITALSMVIEEIAVGDKVNVRIYNNPVEHI
jgi:hypothetical protein